MQSRAVIDAKFPVHVSSRVRKTTTFVVLRFCFLANVFFSACSQEHLQAFAEAADSTYGCLLVNGKVLCATDKWWDLTGQELVLLGRVRFRQRTILKERFPV